MLKKTPIVFAVSASALAVLALGFALGGIVARKARPEQAASLVAQPQGILPVTNSNASAVVDDGTTALVGRISGLKTNDGQMTANLYLVELFIGQDDAGQAAIIDGICTLDQVESGQCLNSSMHIRVTDRHLSLGIASSATATVYAREPGGGMLVNGEGTTYTETLSAKDFTDLYAQQGKVGSGFSQTVFLVRVKGNEIMRLEERLTP